MSSSIDKTDTKAAKKPSCPICQRDTQEAFRPFCSRRCADLDLSRWLNGHYAIPVVEEDGGTSGLHDDQPDS